MSPKKPANIHTTKKFYNIYFLTSTINIKKRQRKVNNTSGVLEHK